MGHITDIQSSRVWDFPDSPVVRTSWGRVAGVRRGLGCVDSISGWVPGPQMPRGQRNQNIKHKQYNKFNENF